MKFSFNILLALCSLIFIGCVKDLDRDNPFDEVNLKNGGGEISVSSASVYSDNNNDKKIN